MADGVGAVLLDADGVLQTNPAGWEDALRALVAPGAGEEFVADLFAAEAPAMIGERDFVPVLAEVCERWSVRVPAEELARHWCDVEVATGTVEVVRAVLAAGTPCHLASNQHAWRAAYLRDGLGYGDLFGTTYFSCELGMTKSDPAFFAQVAADTGIEPGRLLLVDDSERYVEVARAAGLRAVTWCVEDGLPLLRRLLAAEGVLPG